MNVSADTPSATIGAMAEEEEEVEDDGKTVALGKGGVTDLARTAGRTSLARIARKAMQASLRCRRSQGEMRTVIRTRGLGASRNHVRSPTSWAELKTHPLSPSSSSSPAK